MESYFWNNSNVLPPPVNTYKSEDNDIDLNKIIIIVGDAVSVLKSQDVFHKEAAILSRLVYKMGKKFRHDIGFSYLRRTNTALLKYSNLNLVKDINIFLDVVSEAMKNYYPTRQMLEFVLVRLQTFSKLLSRIEMCSKKSAKFYLDRMRRGDAWWLSFMPYSVLCRIWYLSKHLLDNACKWYDDLLPFRVCLKVSGLTFIPEKYEFPVNLKSWVDVDRVEEDENHLLNSDTDISHLPLDMSNNENDNSMDMNTDHKFENIVQEIPKTKHFEDVGEVISRETYMGKNEKSIEKETPVKLRNTIENVKCDNNISNNSNLEMIQINKNKKNKEKLKKGSSKPLKVLIKENNKQSEENVLHSIDVIKDTKSLKCFFSTEEEYRKNGDEKSLTIHLGFMQWQSLKTIITGVVSNVNGKNKNKIQKKIANIWKNKCTSLNEK